MKPESFYGLALPLGGGEITMEELAGLYAMLANQGVLRPLRTETVLSGSSRTIASRTDDAGLRLLSPEAAFVTLDMLRRNPRPDQDRAVLPHARWPVAWKTGTSWGFRDAWSAGMVGPYVLVVWIGNFDGVGNPAFVGVDAAAPLFFRIADALNLARPAETVPPSMPPPGVSRVAVCADSGELPNAHCPRTVETLYIPGKSPIRVSQLHRMVAIDPRTGRGACPPYAADTHFEVFEFWPSDMLLLFTFAMSWVGVWLGLSVPSVWSERALASERGSAIYQKVTWNSALWMSSLRTSKFFGRTSIPPQTHYGRPFSTSPELPGQSTAGRPRSARA
jgi:penicillin-binding protein 1C